MTNDSHEGRLVVIGNMAQRSLTKFTEEGNPLLQSDLPPIAETAKPKLS